MGPRVNPSPLINIRVTPPGESHRVARYGSLAAGLLLLGSVAGAVAAPSRPWPTVPLISRSWHINFTASKPHRVFVRNPQGKVPVQAFWFLRYTVTNPMARDLYFNPRFALIAGNGKIIAPVAAVTPALLETIRTVTGDPFIVNPALVVGKLLQGAENARDSVAVFAGVPPGTGTIRLFVTGLSGTIATQVDPLTHKPVVLHKTLMLRYWIPGRAVGIRPRVRLLSRKWVMR